GDDWKYILPDANTPSDWRNPGFDDSSWNTGPSGFGYGDNDDATVIPTTISLFLRKGFYVEEPSKVSGCILHMDYDDGFAAFINGNEVAKSGISGNPPGYNTTASSGREATMYSGGEPRRFDLTNHTDLLLQGENVIAVQAHNVSGTSSDLSAIPFISLQIPQKPVDLPPVILNLTNTHFHTNFKLDADGDSLYLTNPEGIILDSVYISGMNVNHSYGRKEHEQNKWVVFETATPGSPNNTPFFEGYVEEPPNFSVPGGRFTAPFQLSISALNPGDTIYYSLDGTEPTIHSLMVQDPLEVSSNMVVRARIIRSGFVPGRIITNTYFTGSDNHLPVITISTDPYNLWDHYDGIYVAGPNAENDFPYFGANFWQDWERPAHIELYDDDGNRTINMDAGIKIYGGWTRGHPQKSMAIYARSKYGTKKIETQLFEDKPIYEFESFIIRNSGNDWFG
ncbi:MAG: chitobiase/beta-hexosaminidase C-terminal domain-containing protein, partial [Bacteroidales bacterium]|nr:chitobiase/beta-hexosaminidase C-terminal domain-containing protein [Bacteroidales bacterium]